MNSEKDNGFIEFIKKYGVYIILVLAVGGFVLIDILFKKPDDSPVIVYSNGTTSIQSESETVKKSKKQTPKVVIKTTKSNKTNTLKGNTDTIKSNKKTSEQKSENKDDNQLVITFPMDINTITTKELTYIDGIGDAIANKIIKYRDSVGVITNINMLKNVEGIGDKKLEYLKQYLYVSKDIYQPYTQATTYKKTSSKKTTAKRETVKTTKATTIVYTTSPTSKTKIQTTTENKVMHSVNINTADEQELSEALLINLRIAHNIIKLRDEIGQFSDPLELLYADGISQELYNTIKTYIEI